MFFFQAEDGIRDLVRSRGLGDVYKRQALQIKDYIENKYHRPADNYDPESFNFEGIVEDAALAFRVGYEIANSDFFPKWRKGSEFRMGK